MSTNLTEKYRPQTVDGIVGQARAVTEIKAWLSDPSRNHALALIGGTGLGKTSAARCIAREFAEPIHVEEYDSADDLSVAEIERIRQSMQLHALGKGGRVFIINEIHAVRKDVGRRLLGIFERIPAHVFFILTTTSDGAEMLFEDWADGTPLIDRCETIRFSTNGFAKPAAQRLREIAQAENADGEPESVYLNILKENGNSMRRALGVLEKRIRAKRTESAANLEAQAC